MSSIDIVSFYTFFISGTIARQRSTDRSTRSFHMMRWLQYSTRRACLFGALLAVLTGCNDDVQLPPESTFETAKLPAPVTEVVQIPQEPVVGTVTPVSGAESTPAQMTGGAAVPLGENGEPDKSDSVTDVPPTTPNSQIVLPRLEPVAPPVVVPENIPRFTEIAPDTIGGATYKASSALEYDLGNLVTMNTGDSVSFEGGNVLLTPITGRLYYPETPLIASATAERFPVIVFLHGMHNWSEPSYKGYDYLAKDLAEHGYVVVSIDANVINSTSGTDNSGQSRAQLVLGMLDRLRQIDGFGQVDLGGNLGNLDPLKGRLDFTRIGLMGHSRGGQGVVNTILFNETRRGVTEEDLKAAMLRKPFEALKEIFSSTSDEVILALIAFAQQGKAALTKQFTTLTDGQVSKILGAVDCPSSLCTYPDLVSAIIPAVAARPAIPAVEAKSAIPAIVARPAVPAGSVISFTKERFAAFLAPLTLEQIAQRTARGVKGGPATPEDIANEATRLGGIPRDTLADTLASAHSAVFLSERFPEVVKTAQAIPAVAARSAIPAIEAKPAIPAVEAKPVSIDDTKFQAAVRKYNIFYAAGSKNANSNEAPFYTFRGAFLVGPTDFGANRGVSNVPLAVLLPSCDGDMSNLQGASTYDRNRFGSADDTAPRYQIMVNGANHNYYNTEWKTDDFVSLRGPDYCREKTPPSNSIRLGREDQRKGGLFIINSFMRYHIGGEQKFAAWWNGHARLPDAACPTSTGPCDERVLLTTQKAARSSKLIQRFDMVDSLKRSALGGKVKYSGFDATVRCDMPTAANVAGRCLAGRLPGFEYLDTVGKGLLSIADHVELAWSKPDASIVTDLSGLAAMGNDSLTFRIAVVRPMGQEVLVTLADSAGKTATVTASDFTDALYNPPRRKKGGDVPKEKDLPLTDDPADAPYANGEVKILMNMVAIPLKAFEGVDTTSLKELKLAFPKEFGKVAITDIELQNLGRDKPDQKVATR